MANVPLVFIEAQTGTGYDFPTKTLIIAKNVTWLHEDCLKSCFYTCNGIRIAVATDKSDTTTFNHLDNQLLLSYASCTYNGSQFTRIADHQEPVETRDKIREALRELEAAYARGVTWADSSEEDA